MDRRPIRSWGTRLGGDGEPLSLAEAQLLATMATADNTKEVLTVLQDIQGRLVRMELYLSLYAPGYNDSASRILGILQESSSPNGETVELCPKSGD